MPFFISSKKITQLVNAAVQPLIKQALQPFIGSTTAYKIGGTIYPTWESFDHIDNLVTSYDVFSVIDKIASAVASVDVEAYIKTPDKKQLKRYKAKPVNDPFKKIAKIKALTELPEDNALSLLLDKPCPGILTEREHRRLTTMLYLASGEVYMWKERTLSGKIIALHIFSGPDTAIQVTGEYPYKIAAYDFSIGGTPVLKNIPPKDVIAIKTGSPVYNKNGQHLRGFSPLSPGQTLTNRINTTDARADATLKNGTVPGIIFLKDSPDAPEYSAWRSKYQRFIENDDNGGAAFPISGEVGYIQTGLKMADMQLMELQNMTFEKLCNLYRISTILFNSKSSATESNVKEMRKDFYTSAVIPCADAIDDAINQQLIPDFDSRYYTESDFSEIPELQIDLLATMNAISAMPISLTGNEIRDLLNYESSDADNMDIPMLKQGYSPVNNIDILPAPGAGLP
jgi:HK97 family phage portal protein